MEPTELTGPGLVTAIMVWGIAIAFDALLALLVFSIGISLWRNLKN
jgi:hypothetical protein